MILVYLVLIIISILFIVTANNNNICPTKRKRLAYKFIGIVLLCLSLGGCYNSLQDFKVEQAHKEQQERFAAQKAKDEQAKVEFLDLWYKISYMTVSYNNFWDTQFLPTVEGLGNGTVDRMTGYKNLQELHVASNITFSKMEDLKAPTGLTSMQQKKINDALQAYRNSVAMRVTSSKKLMEIVDYNNARPSEVNTIIENLALSSTGTSVLYGAMNEVAKELNITLPSEQSEFERHNKENN